MSATDSLDRFRLDGRVAIVTGAAGLLGGEHATALAGAGADVVLADRFEAPCVERAAALAARTGRRALGLSCDVTSREAWEALAERVVAEFGRVDILVNNAAFTNDSRSPNYGAAFEDFPLEDWRATMDVNLTGTFLGCQVVGRRMLAAGRGSIVNIASLYGVVSPHHRIYEGTGVLQPPSYSVSKTAVIGLTRYVATLWADRGVRVNALTPGGVFNEHGEPFLTRYGRLNPTGRMARADEMSGALLYLASDASSYCTGHNLVVDGGWTAW